MKVSTTIFAVLLSASVALAQTGSAPAKPAGGTPSKSGAGAKAAPSKSKQAKTAGATAAKPAATPFAQKPAAAPAQPELKPAAQEVKPAAAVTQPPPAPPVQQVKPYSSVGKRDPFISPIQVATTGAGACSGGKRCLIINQVTLRGIVKSVNGWIAVVENPAQKTYFLRENDAVLNGFVARITGETVVFKENITDALGQQTQRDVVKYVSAPVV
ncbi:MAG: hypothetical protein L0Z53_28000 [Acidobacteriales bacterium]|nr:hypothetical protein [Terriglobales bacterium]